MLLRNEMCYPFRIKKIPFSGLVLPWKIAFDDGMMKISKKCAVGIIPKQIYIFTANLFAN